MNEAPLLDFQPLHSALQALREALAQPMKNLSIIQEQMMKESLIQRFEYTYELCWRAMKRWLEMRFPDETFDRFGRHDLFRRAKEVGLILDEKLWFEYLEGRNRTSHAYDHKIAEEVFALIPGFAREAEAVLKKLELEKV